ncbi:unnamed protein product [Linum trigynum]|uniref:BZIP domain-containing protein n=1 Tax=Linum trigynum TaxID=586398 RepID=A0AAV2CXU2_9ROSI
MASSSLGASSGSTGGALMRNSSSEDDLNLVLMDERKRKRKLSNRESARRSRMRKQNHLDELSAQVAQLTKDNAEIVASVNLKTQLFLGAEAENSVLRAQAAELSHRLDSLNEIVNYVDSLRYAAVPAPTTTAAGGATGATTALEAADDCFMMMNNENPWSCSAFQPVMDMVMY